jgi:hypothetical protein
MIYQRGGLYTDSWKGVETVMNYIIRIGYNDRERICIEQKQ